VGGNRFVTAKQVDPLALMGHVSREPSAKLVGLWWMKCTTAPRRLVNDLREPKLCPWIYGIP